MGAWGSAPWHNDGAADWFAEVFQGIDIDAHIDQALKYDDDFDRIRAAGYLLTVLGHSTVWPGDLERLDNHLERAIELLTEMAEPDSEFLELWEDEPGVLEAVQAEIAALEARLAGEDDEEDEEEDDDDEEDEE
ncbi:MULTISPECIES: DUF4259 domain-containing protein [Leucobacter]|uniref:DUF4259 domain-containing protein n=1 Tax=Leucobacter TaxID=55968 RepID=UPI0013C47370|nr:DUF4259 domain-containing protein [Leucobacter aridicollis]UTX52641.1 hypothetical protein KI794_13030 [Leucobacter aridicollis]